MRRKCGDAAAHQQQHERQRRSGAARKDEQKGRDGDEIRQWLIMHPRGRIVELKLDVDRQHERGQERRPVNAEQEQHRLDRRDREQRKKAIAEASQRRDDRGENRAQSRRAAANSTAASAQIARPPARTPRRPPRRRRASTIAPAVAKQQTMAVNKPEVPRLCENALNDASEPGGSASPKVPSEATRPGKTP